MLRKAALLSVALFVVGCGGPGSFNGTVDGKSLSVADAVFVPLNDSNGNKVGVVLVMSDVPDICSAMKANRAPKGATSATFVLMRFGSDGKVLAPDVGDFKLTDNLDAQPTENIGFGGFSKSDANCTNEVASDHSGAKSGLVKVDSIELKSGGALSGTFDATFGTQNDKATGSFNAEYCDAPTTRDSKANCE